MESKSPSINELKDAFFSLKINRSSSVDKVSFNIIKKCFGVLCERFMVKPQPSDIRVHTSDIRMAYEYIRVTYRWHRSTCEWHTDDIGVYTSDIRMTYEWQTDDMRFKWKIKLIFLKPFINYLSKYLINKRIPFMQGLFWVIYQN